ncbi:hypothetical protein BASA81_005762 [Batrachochytrium salamandrivorans]|nr:hypothetical protein BASA81_005762 [Batrachochytrium salamandrivorans]
MHGKNLAFGLLLVCGAFVLLWFTMAEIRNVLSADGGEISTLSLRAPKDLVSITNRVAELERKAVEAEMYYESVKTIQAKLDSVGATNNVDLSTAIEAKVRKELETQFAQLKSEVQSALLAAKRAVEKPTDNAALLKHLAELEQSVTKLQNELAVKTAEAARFIDDFTSCSNYLVHPVKQLAFPKPSGKGNAYEFIRIGVSDFCVPGKTDVSVFFTLQALATGGRDDCLNENLSQVSVRFGRLAMVSETKAQMVGCFQDDAKRSWRFFAARLSALEPDQPYQYTIEHEVNSPVRSFYSPPLPGAEQETNILFVGDTMHPGADFVMKEAAKQSNMHDLVVHVGDGTYGTNNGACYGQRRSREPTSECGWDCTGIKCDGAGRMSAQVLDKIRVWTKSFDDNIKGGMAWMTTMGNHDNDLQWFLSMRPTCASALPGVHPDDVIYSTNDALKVFAHSSLGMREVYSKALDYMKSPHFYSFDYGKVHVVSLGSEDNPMNAYEEWDGEPLDANQLDRFERHYGKHSKQYKWLIKDLSDAKRNLVPWVVVFTHRPLYSTAYHHANCQAGGDWYACKFRDTYEPVFRQFNVDLVVSGHSHHYSRSQPMYKGQIDRERGIVYSVIGVGGFEVTGESFSQANWIASRQGSEFGYVRMVVKNATHAKWTHQLITGKVFDETWLVRRP